MAITHGSFEESKAKTLHVNCTSWPNPLANSGRIERSIIREKPDMIIEILNTDQLAGSTEQVIFLSTELTSFIIKLHLFFTKANNMKNKRDCNSNWCNIRAGKNDINKVSPKKYIDVDSTQTNSAAQLQREIEENRARTSVVSDHKYNKMLGYMLKRDLLDIKQEPDEAATKL
uniref:Uncharacterized protein n=1 Tax=Romanomermis culicivorax TaxID=13658 RepID=A0A915K7F0_ROMCU